MNKRNLSSSICVDTELWKPVKGYEGYYEISNKGRVRSLERRIKRGNHTVYVKGKLLKKGVNYCGYPCVTLTKNRIGGPFTLHRLIANAFIPNPDNLPEVDHINTDRSDYRIENLRWVTHKDNTNNIITLQNRRNSLYSKETISKGLETRKQRNCVNGPKTVYQYTKDGVLVKEYYSMQEAKRETGIRHIGEVLDNNTASSGGFLWTSSPKQNYKYQASALLNNKTVQQYDTNGKLLGEWPSIKEASKHTGIHISAIYRNIKAANPRKYKFKYREKDI